MVDPHRDDVPPSVLAVSQLLEELRVLGVSLGALWIEGVLPMAQAYSVLRRGSAFVVIDTYSSREVASFDDRFSADDFTRRNNVAFAEALSRESKILSALREMRLRRFR